MSVPISAPAYPPLKIQPLQEPLYLATGGAGANSGVIIGREHVLLIDAKMTADTVRELSAIINAQFGKPVSTILLTHSDIDHVAGLDAWPPPFVVVAQEATKREITAQAERVPVTHLPDITFSKSHGFDFEGIPVELLHIGPAHTGGDTVALFPSLRTAFVGDLLFYHRDPLIHRHKGGSSAGLVAALNLLQTLDVDRFASGHSDPVGKAEIKQLRETIALKREQVRSGAGQKSNQDMARFLYQAAFFISAGKNPCCRQ